MLTARIVEPLINFDGDEAGQMVQTLNARTQEQLDAKVAAVLPMYGPNAEVQYDVVPLPQAA